MAPSGGALDLLDGVDRGPAGNRRVVFFGRLDDVLNDFGGNKGTHGIVHQDDVVRIGGQGLQRVRDGVLAMLAAFDQLQRLFQDFWILLFELGAKAGDLVLTQGDDDLMNGGLAANTRSV